MEHLELPHHHGAQENNDFLYKELSKTDHFHAVAECFKQLSDPVRVRIFWLLCHKEECVWNIAAWMHMSSPAVSHHLRSLYESGLITSRRYGKEVYYKAAETEVSAFLHKAVEKAMAIACPMERIDDRKSAEEVVRQMHGYLTEHLSERITIEELSKKFLMNPTTLKKVFKEVYGVSLAAHMKQHRMEEAAKMLKESTLRVAQIAVLVGYESQSRFTTAFRDCYGILPTEYRKTAKKEGKECFHNLSPRND